MGGILKCYSTMLTYIMLACLTELLFKLNNSYVYKCVHDPNKNTHVHALHLHSTHVQHMQV